jgi:2-polyprenyl-6-methoxyphenol hydroxylase-like FAD-dependent oxidoreductase
MSASNPGAGARSGHAVVVGGSVAGLTAARVLADHFEKVTLVERDPLADSSEFRKGVPQGQHTHVLLKKGLEILSRLFPRLPGALEAAGASTINVSAETAWWHYGGWKARPSSTLESVFATRPLLELEIRKQIEALPGVQVRRGTNATGLIPSADKRRVQGVALKKDGGEEALAADLVVDASGRGSRLPAWLESMGRSKVKESVVTVDLAYSTRIFKQPPGDRPWKVLMITGQSPASKRGSLIVPVEGGRWLATLVGMLGDHPPSDEAGWMEFARSLPAPDFYDVVKAAEPLSEVMTYKFSAHQRRHYERMADFPAGLVALGDGVCSFNPVYAQGMTTSIVGADLLAQHLAAASRSGSIGSESFTRGYQKALSSTSQGPWDLATGEDFRYPATGGERPFGLGGIHWYAGRFHRLSRVDPDFTRVFYDIAHMMAPINALMTPGIIWKVLTGKVPSG